MYVAQQIETTEREAVKVGMPESFDLEVDQMMDGGWRCEAFIVHVDERVSVGWTIEADPATAVEVMATRLREGDVRRAKEALVGATREGVL